MIKPLSFAKKSRKILLLQLFFCGEYRNRTDDLLTASEFISSSYQLNFRYIVNSEITKSNKLIQ